MKGIAEPMETIVKDAANVISYSLRKILGHVALPVTDYATQETYPGDTKRNEQQRMAVAWA